MERDLLLAVAAKTDDRMAETGTRPEPMFGIIMMVVTSNGGEMEEDLLSLSSRILLAAAQQANCVGRQAIYEFVADTLVRAVDVPESAPAHVHRCETVGCANPEGGRGCHCACGAVYHTLGWQEITVVGR